MKKVTKKAVAAAKDDTQATASFEISCLLSTREQLIAAFKLWIIDTRIGRCASYEEAAAMSAEENAEADTDTLIAYLDKVRAS